MRDYLLKNGMISFTELMTTNVEAAKGFYKEVFGWELKAWPMECGGEYTVISCGEEDVGGMMSMPKELADMNVPPHWTSYVTVDDIDQVAAKTVEIGGEVLHGPMDIPKVGRFAVLKDPTGGVISAITYSAESCQCECDKDKQE